MCIIIENQKGKKIKTSVIADLYQRNNDGFGIYYTDANCEPQNRLIKLLDADLATVTRHLNSQRPYVAHMRYTTMGATDTANLHPHVINDNYLLIHNGTVKGLGGDTVSDTAELAAMLSDIPVKLWPQLLAMGKPSRFCIVDRKTHEVMRYGPVGSTGDNWNLYGDYIFFSKNYTKPVYTGQNYTGTSNKWHQGPAYKTTSTSTSTGKKSTGKKSTGKKSTGKFNPIKLFVYGTLKHSYHNNHLLKNSNFLGEYYLSDYGLTGTAIPYCHEVAGQYVTGELYEVTSASMLAAIDRLEGHPNHYKRSKTTAYSLLDDEPVSCSVYLDATGTTAKDFYSEWPKATVENNGEVITLDELFDTESYDH